MTYMLKYVKKNWLNKFVFLRNGRYLNNNCFRMLSERNIEILTWKRKYLSHNHWSSFSVFYIFGK